MAALGRLVHEAERPMGVDAANTGLNDAEAVTGVGLAGTLP